MKKKKFQLSRKAKTLIYTSIAALSLAAIIAGNFPITPWNSFRLAEKARLVGPATILGTESVVSSGQDAVIIAKNEEFCMTYGYKFFAFNNTDSLVCKKKTGDLTFLSIAYRNCTDSHDHKEDYCSIILFDDYPQAVRATLTIQPYMEYKEDGSEKVYERSYTVTATRQKEAYFFFRLSWWEHRNQNDSDRWLYDSVLMYNITQSLNFNPNAVVTYSVPGKIQLYDKNDNLILEREIDLKNPNPQ